MVIKTPYFSDVSSYYASVGSGVRVRFRFIRDRIAVDLQLGWSIVRPIRLL